MAAEFRRMGGEQVPLTDAPELVKDPGHVALGWRALGLRAGTAEMVVRRLTFPSTTPSSSCGADILLARRQDRQDHLLSHRGRARRTSSGPNPTSRRPSASASLTSPTGALGAAEKSKGSG